MRHTIHRTNSTLASLILIALLGVCAIGVAQVDTWTRKADLPTPSQALSASVVNGKIYAIGGSGRVRRRSVVEAYDPAVDTWTRKPDMPTPRRRHNTRVLDGKIYAIGGQDSDGNPFSAMEVYDPSTDTWTRKADIPTLRHNFSISVVDGRIYVIGGSIPVDNEFRPLSTVEAYDPATDTCTRKSDMPTPRGFLSTSLVNGKIYAIGGWDGINPISTVEAYGPQTDIWTRKVDMPTPRSDLTTHVVNEKIYAIRGWDGNQWIPTVEAYAPQTDIWTRKTPKPTVSGNFWPLDRSTTVVNAEIYVIGGLTTVGSLVSTSVVEAYDPETDTWTRKADLLVPRHDFATGFVEGQIYVMGGNDGRTNPSVVEAYDTGFGIRVTTVSPKAGQMAGGDHITILGRGFPAGATVTVGGEPLTELKVTDMLITGVTPAGTAGEQDIVITAPGLSDPVRIAPFIYIGPGDLLVTEMTPSTGVQAGGETGSITGSGFQDGVTVKVGEAQATVLLVTPTLITFTLPPGTEGTKDVVVTNPGGRAEILRDAYTYTPFPTISRIAPNEGALAGGTQITIHGRHFTKGLVVTIGGVQVGLLDVLSPTELRLQVPPGSPGAKLVRVVNPDEQAAALAGGFTYHPAPTISSITPNAGPLSGGTGIIITGTGFLSPVDVIIGDAQVTVTTTGGGVSPTRVVTRTPSSSAGTKDVSVLNRDGQAATLKAAFTYNVGPVITGVIPDNGKLAGGTKIVIQGSGFLPGAEIRIGDIRRRTFIPAASQP